MTDVRTYAWELPARTCERGDHRAITLGIEVDLSADDDPILLAIRLNKTGPGLTCGEKWAAIWAERAVAKLGWLGMPLGTILASPRPVDAFSCACTEVSLGPKLWRLLATIAP